MLFLRDVNSEIPIAAPATEHGGSAFVGADRYRVDRFPVTAGNTDYIFIRIQAKAVGAPAAPAVIWTLHGATVSQSVDGLNSVDPLARLNSDFRDPCSGGDFLIHEDGATLAAKNLGLPRLAAD